jgi:LmbE family N-acetylglucosaminyl deacetylase
MIDLRKQKLLILAPHPDDEILGCGGLIKKIKDAGGKVYVLFLSVGTTEDYSKNGKSTGSERMREIEAVAKLLQYDDYAIAFTGKDYHLRMDTVAQKDLIHAIERGSSISIDRAKPTIIATTHANDYNQDHKACAEALFAATRPTPKSIKASPDLILGYESTATAQWASVPSFNPNFFTGLSKIELGAKIEALQLYASQIRADGHQRSPEGLTALATYRGFQAGVAYAEAYFSYRMVL